MTPATKVILDLGPHSLHPLDPQVHELLDTLMQRGPAHFERADGIASGVRRSVMVVRMDTEREAIIEAVRAAGLTILEDVTRYCALEGTHPLSDLPTGTKFIIEQPFGGSTALMPRHVLTVLKTLPDGSVLTAEGAAYVGNLQGTIQQEKL